MASLLDANSIVEKTRVTRESAIDLAKLLGSQVYVELHGGRHVSGVLKGHDLLTNMVLDQVTETIHERDGTSRQRSLGVVVIRGTQVSVVVPTEGMSEIENPFPSIE